jgi:aarF domain-containing kinase
MQQILPREYDRNAIEEYWKQRPISVLSRIGSIGLEFTPLFFNYLVDFKLRKHDASSTSTTTTTTSTTSNSDLEEKYRRHAIELRKALTRLGPAFIKFGQQLSIRPDLLPACVLKELQTLCDAVDPIPDEVAFQIIKEDLGGKTAADELGNLGLLDMEDIELVAAASLGQVYKAKLKSGENVAIKVQRPDMVERVSLDLFLLNQYGLFLDTIFEILTEQVPFHVDFIDCFAKGSYLELDYENEAKNQEYFRRELSKRKSKVYIPKVYPHLTSRRVLTTEWIDGVKLANADRDTIKRLIPIGVELFMTQLLDIGAFHSDPHSANLYVTKDGKLCLLDFGLCAEIDVHARNAMTTAIVHLLTGDFDTLIARDAKDLGFLPQDMDVSELKPILTKILTQGLLESGSNLHARKRKLMSISDELNEVFFRYPFSVPPFFALITRGLGLLEGIALSGDSDFDIFQASYPYARKRAAQIYGTHHGWYSRLQRT